MGFYIQTDGRFNKAEYLEKHHGAKKIPQSEAVERCKNGEGIICVVSNAAFEAAAYAYDERECEAFMPTFDDRRPRIWLTMDKALACELTGYDRKPTTT